MLAMRACLGAHEGLRKEWNPQSSSLIYTYIHTIMHVCPQMYHSYVVKMISQNRIRICYFDVYLAL